MSRFHLLPPPLPLRLFLQQGTESPPASAKPAIYSHSPEGKERRQHVGGRGVKQEGKENKRSIRETGESKRRQKEKTETRKKYQTNRHRKNYLGKSKHTK